VGHATFIDMDLASALLNRVENALIAMRSLDEAVPAATQLFNGHPDNPDSRYYSIDGSLDCPPLGIKEFEWTEEAEKLRTEIEALSGATNVDENVSVFELGLDSIDMIKLASRLKSRGISISVGAIVKSQTVAKMTTKIAKEDDTREVIKRTKDYEERLAMHLQDIDRLSENVVAVLPATPLQEGMIAEMTASGYAKYFNHEVFRIEHDVDVEKLKASWDVVIRGNEIFQTHFVEIEDADLPISYAQVIRRPSVSSWITIELAKDANLEAEIREIVKEAIKLAKIGKLLQLRNMKRGDEEYLLLSICHALYDGWSLQALHGDVWKAYHGEVVTRPDPRLALEQVVAAQGPEATKFWKAALTGLPRCRFPQRKSPSIDDVEITHRQERLSHIPLAKIREFCRSMSITLQTLGQTCWAFLLASYTRRLNIAFGAVLSCRDTDDANELMFPLMNTVAVRSVIHGSIEDMLHYMQANGNSIRQYQHFPLRRAQAFAGDSDGRLFDTLFIYQGRSRGSVSAENRLYQSAISVSEVEFPVCVEMEIIGEIMVLRTACRESARTETETYLLLQELDNVLKRIISDPRAPSIVSGVKGVSVCGLQSFLVGSSQIAPGSQIGEQIANPAKNPWTVSEKVIRAVLSRVSKVAEEQITKDQTIFHLGLDSISAIKVSSILRRKGITISVNNIMKNNSVRSMAQFVDRASDAPLQDSDDSDDAFDTLKHVDREAVIQGAGFKLEDIEDVLPVTAGQLYMLARWQASDGALFMGTFKYNLIRSVDKGKLEGAWKALRRKYPILRTVFVPTGESKLHFLQVVLKDTSGNVGLVQPVDRQDSCSLTSPLSVTVEEFNGHDFLRLRIHHALYDAVSLPLMAKELQELYLGESKDVLPSKNFREFVFRSVNEWASAVQRRREFWVSYLHRETLLPVMEQSLPRANHRIEAFIPEIPIGDVVLVGQRLGVSVDALLLAVFSNIYSNLVRQNVPTNSDEVVFGLYLANRAVYGEDLSTMMAPTLNLLPLRVKGIGSTCVVDVARRIQMDLRRISSAEVVGTSLAEIHAWTGVRVNCFVNILRTLDEGESELTCASASCSQRGGDKSRLFEDKGGEETRRECVVDVVQMRADPRTKTNAGKGYNIHSAEAYLVSTPVPFTRHMHPSTHLSAS
jgi:ferricrocin synthase